MPNKSCRRRVLYVKKDSRRKRGRKRTARAIIITRGKARPTPLRKRQEASTKRACINKR